MPSTLKWIVKLDDDVILNVTKLDSYLMKHNISEEAIHCPIKSSTGIITHNLVTLIPCWYRFKGS